MPLIHYQKGDIFESNAQVIVNTVNCKGVMGKGLALTFKQRYPDMFATYQQECKTGKLHIGRPTLYQKSTPWILNFPTKDHWRFPSKLEYLEKGLQFLAANYKKADIKSIAFPKLGAQNGQLSWDETGPLMARYLSQLDIDVYVYIADGDVEYQYDNYFEGKIWRQFSEIAFSPERLHQEIGLSSKEAKKLVEKRGSTEFRGLADIESIDGLAKVSLKKIKEYISSQRYIAPQLAGLSGTNDSDQKMAKKVPQSPTYRRKKSDTTVEVSEEPLFPVKELAI